MEKILPTDDENALAKPYYWTSSDEVLLTYDAAPAVDLSIADSPVCRGWLEPPIQTQRTQGRGYVLLNETRDGMLGRGTFFFPEQISEETCKFYRARYLVRCAYFALYIDCLPLAYYERDQMLHQYFGGSLWQPPEPLLSKSRIDWRKNLQRVRERPREDPGTVEGRIVNAVLKQIAERHGP